MLDATKHGTTGDAGRILGLGPERVRQLERAGLLEAVRTVGGVRIFNLDQVREVAHRREQERRAR